MPNRPATATPTEHCAQSCTTPQVSCNHDVDLVLLGAHLCDSEEGPDAFDPSPFCAFPVSGVIAAAQPSIVAALVRIETSGCGSEPARQVQVEQDGNASETECVHAAPADGRRCRLRRGERLSVGTLQRTLYHPETGSGGR